MKILHTADWHLGKLLEGHSRLDEQALFLEQFISWVEHHDVDLVLHAGDVFDTYNPSAAAEALFYQALKRINRNGKTVVAIVAGNHDNPNRLEAISPLTTEEGILIAGSLQSVFKPGPCGAHRILSSGEGYVELAIKEERVVLLMLPYPSEKRLDQVIFHSTQEDDDKARLYNQKIQTIFQDLESRFRPDTVNLALSHLFAMGVSEEGTERSIQLGGSYLLDANCLPQNAQYVALGHIHKPQIVPGTGQRVRYSGSPLHYNVRETSFDKQCLLIEVRAGQSARIESLAVPVYRPIERWKAQGVEHALELCQERGDQDCFVYLEIATEQVIAQSHIKEMKRRKSHLLEIRPVFPEPEKQNAPVPEQGLLQDPDPSQLFCAFYLRERGVLPTPEITELFVSLLQEEETDEAPGAEVSRPE